MGGVDVQLACDDGDVPEPGALRRWARAALEPAAAGAELTVRVVGAAEGARLNRAYRGAQGPTNVLAFPFEAPPGAELALLGDVVVCAPVVAREAREQGKEPAAHWAHLVVHGTLHLQGYDHHEPAAARRMEAREREVLATLGFPDPYREERR